MFGISFLTCTQLLVEHLVIDNEVLESVKNDIEGSQTVLQAPIKSSRKQHIPVESTETLKESLQLHSNPSLNEEVCVKRWNHR